MKPTTTANSNARPTVYRSSDAAFPCGTRPTITKENATGGSQQQVAGASKATAGNTVAKRISQQKYDNAKCSDPFASNSRKCKTSFSASYVQGNIPCRLQSSAAKYSLQWDGYAAEGFSPDLLVVCADGLSETTHPHVLMAPMMFEELIGRTNGCVDMLAPVIPTVTTHIRKALLDSATTAAGLKAMLLLAQASGNLLLHQLAKLVPVLAKPMRDKKFHDQVMAIFGVLEQNIGPEATRIIKSKVPTYT